MNTASKKLLLLLLLLMLMLPLCRPGRVSHECKTMSVQLEKRFYSGQIWGHSPQQSRLKWIHFLAIQSKLDLKFLQFISRVKFITWRCTSPFVFLNICMYVFVIWIPGVCDKVTPTNTIQYFSTSSEVVVKLQFCCLCRKLV